MLATLLLSTTAIVAGFWCLRGAENAAWRWLGAGLIVWPGGHAVAFAADAGDDRVAAASFAGQFVAVLFAAIGSALLLRGNARGRESTLDGLGIGVSVVNVSAAFLIQPLIGLQAADSAALGAISLQVAWTALMLINATGLAWANDSSRRGVFALLLLAFFVPFVTLTVSSTVAGEIQTASSPAMVAACVVSFASVGLARWVAAKRTAPATNRFASERTYLRQLLSIGMVAVLLQTMATTKAVSDPGRNWLVLSSVVFLGFLLALRLNMAAQLADRLAVRTRERDRLASVLDLSGVIGVSPTPEDLMRQIAATAAGAADCLFAELVVREPSGGLAIVTHGTDDVSEADRLAAARLLSAITEATPGTLTGKPVVLTASDQGLPELVRAAWRRTGRTASLAVGLSMPGDLTGYIAAWRSGSATAFHSEDVATLAVVAQKGSVALQNAFLLERERSLASQRALMLRVGRAATSSLDLYTVLGEIADASIGISGVECAAFEIWHPETDELEIAAQVSVPEWPDVDEPGARYPVGYWDRDRELLRSRDPICISLDDPTLDETTRQRLEEDGTGSMLVVPVWVGDRCVGLADFFSRRRAAFGEDAVLIGVEIAQHVALAINNAQHHEAERLRAEERSILLRVSRSATSSLDLHTVLAEVTEASLGVPGAESCAVMLLRREDDDMELGAESTIPEWPGTESPGTRFAVLPTSRYGRIRHDPAPFIIDRELTELEDVDLQDLITYGAGSKAVFPLWIGDQPVGAMELYSRRCGAFPPDSIRLGTEIATQTALAIRNAQLMGETQRVADAQAALLRVSRAVISGASLDEIAAEVCATSLELGHFDGVEVLILDDESSAITVVGRACVAGWPLNITPVGQSLSLDRQPNVRKLMERGVAGVLDQRTPGLSGAERRALLGEHPRATAFTVPLVIGAACSGLLAVFHSGGHVVDEFTSRLIQDIAGQLAIAVERSQLSAQLEIQATTDGLTSLLNHRTILERLDHEIRSAERREDPVSLIMLDLDRFKEINDTYGHVHGDRVLQLVADVLRASVRAIDHIGRYGGDEFMVVLPGVDAVEAIDIADRIMAAGRSVRAGTGNESLALSVGVAVFPAMATTRDELVDAADHAMYESKLHHGRPAPRTLAVQPASY